MSPDLSILLTKHVADPWGFLYWRNGARRLSRHGFYLIQEVPGLLISALVSLLCFECLDTSDLPRTEDQPVSEKLHSSQAPETSKNQAVSMALGLEPFQFNAVTLGTCFPRHFYVFLSHGMNGIKGIKGIKGFYFSHLKGFEICLGKYNCQQDSDSRDSCSRGLDQPIFL